MSERDAALAALAALEPDPARSARVAAQLQALEVLASAQIPDGVSPDPAGIKLRPDVVTAFKAETLLEGVSTVGPLVSMPPLAGAPTRPSAPQRGVMRATRIERVSDGKELQLPSWPPTREDA